MNEERMPVLIGCGQITDRQTPEEGMTPIQIMAEVARRAAADTGVPDRILQSLDVAACVGLVVDSPDSNSGAKGLIRNVPGSLCKALDIGPREQVYTYTGGNTPQWLVNGYAQRIADGEVSGVLLAGAEALHTMIGRLKAGLDLEGWQEDIGSDPQMLGDPRPPTSEHESSYGILTPSVTYPLFENALRGKYGLSLEQHRARMGELYSRFNAVAADNPLSWFPTRRSASDIAEVSPSNRYVGFPYTKYLNSVIQVNMGAAVIMTSVARARELGVPEDRFVYLHGCADANEIWHMSERLDYCSSPAIRTMGEKAFAMAGKTVDDMDFLDLYSCFPSAVQIACDELGVDVDDPRGLTVTGGLPYFGGPGNNYVMHSIATMMDRLREQPGTFGLLNGNGWFVTKHSLGIYSTTPVSGDWEREDPAVYQRTILDVERTDFTEHPKGEATIETYTVLHGRGGVERALVIGRLADGTRFLAETPDDEATLQGMMEQDCLGLAGTVSSGEKNLFVPRFD